MRHASIVFGLIILLVGCSFRTYEPNEKPTPISDSTIFHDGTGDVLKTFSVFAPDASFVTLDATSYDRDAQYIDLDYMEIEITDTLFHVSLTMKNLPDYRRDQGDRQVSFYNDGIKEIIVRVSAKETGTYLGIPNPNRDSGPSIIEKIDGNLTIHDTTLHFTIDKTNLNYEDLALINKITSSTEVAYFGEWYDHIEQPITYRDFYPEID